MTGTTSKTARPRRNPWPIAIIGYFIVFISAMVCWIVYASHQRQDLVRADYYEKEVLFQQQIDAASRARRVADVKVAYDFGQQAITVQVPASHKAADASGTIQFYRPNNAKLDHNVPMNLAADGTQRLDAKSLQPGLWKVRLSWRVQNEDYYFDQSVVVGGNS